MMSEDVVAIVEYSYIYMKNKKNIAVIEEHVWF